MQYADQRFGQRWRWTAAGVVAFSIFASGVVRGADELPEGPQQPLVAGLVRVRLPLTGGAEIVEKTLLQARERLLEQAQRQGDARRPALVLEMAPMQGAAEGGAGSQFERAFALAELVSSREFAEVKTIAWIPQSLRGHGVLVAAACEEIVMAEEAVIGEAGVDETEGRAMRRAVVEAYREIASSRGALPSALAVAMVDRDVEALRVESEESEQFLLADELPSFRAEHDVISQDTLSPVGSLAKFTGGEGRRYGFVKYLAGTREDLAKALGTAPQSLVEDQSLAAAWRPIVIDVNGPLTRRRVSEINALVGNE
ncbi:MAG: hypothetical protein KDA61_07270, partial [Planctomycetales bacterium]|nr:hypothetical protein [Planctomycetales bacterium]